MYFAVLDGELRAASNGKQSLDDLLLAMVDRRRHSLLADQAAWVELLRSHLGEKGKAEFEAMLDGAVVLPRPQDFGPCFTRITEPMRRYQLDFEPRVLVEPKRVVRGLIPGSAAEVAGGRNGDEITQPVPQDQIQAQQDGVLTLKLCGTGVHWRLGMCHAARRWKHINGSASDALMRLMEKSEFPAEPDHRTYSCVKEISLLWLGY
ncbi:hypothetical protein RBB79_11350 [Tunturiibacter empetritectus]|uniref:Uncharacterized protein n=2 Tax=Tunturiibacter TaxID=3154218 RepID=A0A852VEU2_9BACT|nr:hypothetical protein [Edaphobacter lichenicola]NYF90170.1 hypothetical protein [Edaphobacter lichenicola]